LPWYASTREADFNPIAADIDKLPDPLRTLVSHRNRDGNSIQSAKMVSGNESNKLH